MIEYVPKMIQFAKTGSLAMIAIAGLMLAAYMISKAVCIRPARTLVDVAIPLAMDGAGFYVLFLTLEIIAKNIGML